MTKISQEFVSSEHRSYKMALGRINASSLSGFIAGAIVASIVFLTGILLSIYFFQ